MGELLQRFDQHYQTLYASFTDLEDQVYYRSSRSKFREIVRELEKLPVRRCLEVGTSEFGFMLKQLNPEWELDTLDYGDGKRRRAEALGIPFFDTSVVAPELPLQAGHYDTILFSEVVEHIQGNPRQAFRNLAAALAPGGRLIVTTPNLVRFHNRVKFMLGRSPLERIGEPGRWGGHIREYTLEELLDFCRDAGLDVLRADRPMYWDERENYLAAGPRGFDAEGKFYYRPYFCGWKRPLGHLASFGLRAIARRWPGLRQAQFLVATR